MLLQFFWFLVSLHMAIMLFSGRWFTLLMMVGLVSLAADKICPCPVP